MKKNTIIALAAFLILLGAVLIPKFLPDKSDDLDFQLARAKGVADLIEIHKDDQVIRLVQDDRSGAAPDEGEEVSWKMESPFQFKANDSTIETLLKIFHEPVGMDLKIPASEGELVKYGLDEDERVGLKMAAGENVLFHILVGKAVGNRTFIMKPGDQFVYRARTNLKWQMDKEVNDWREKKILRVKRDQVTGLELSGSGEKVVLTRVSAKGEEATKDGAGGATSEAWRLEEPVTADGDTGAIGSLLGSLLNLRAADFADNMSFQDAGFTPDSPRLTVKQANGDQTTIIIGGKVGANLFNGQYENDRFVTLEGGTNALYIVKDYALEGLKKSAAQLRDKNMLTFVRDDLTSMTITDKMGKTGLVFNRGEEGWGADEPASLRGKDLNMGNLNSLINTLSNLKATEVHEELAQAETGLGGARAANGKISLTMADGTTHTLAIGHMSAPETGEYYANLEGRSVTFTLSEHVVRQIQRDPAAYLNQ